MCQKHLAIFPGYASNFRSVPYIVSLKGIYYVKCEELGM